MQLTDEQMTQLCHVVMQTMYEKGLKGTTMDLVASRLHISKRTLYEIFDNKIEMLTTALDIISRERELLMAKAMRESDNILEGILKVFDMHREYLAPLNVNFFKDMDRLYRMMRHEYDKRRAERSEATARIFMTGVKEGYFRSDLNYRILYRTIELQMESLKRMEELFPPDTSLVDIYQTITSTFLRGITTPKGQKIVDRHYASTEEGTHPNK